MLVRLQQGIIKVKMNQEQIIETKMCGSYNDMQQAFDDVDSSARKTFRVNLRIRKHAAQ